MRCAEIIPLLLQQTLEENTDWADRAD
jgi:hypothetical protein